MFYEEYLKNEKERVQSDDEFVKLARKAIEYFIINNKTIELDEDLPEIFYKERKGVFVSIHKFNHLRGCIGTYLPMYRSLGEEIIQNAISAATRDARFERITEDELNYLEINVDILSTPEKVDSIEELDAKKYGVIITSGFKRGLLLPDIEGVNTVEEQIEIAMKKGNIGKDEEINIERFTVERHK